MHPNELVLVRRASSGAMLPTPAFGALVAEGVPSEAHREAIGAQVERQKAALSVTP